MKQKTMHLLGFALGTTLMLRKGRQATQSKSSGSETERQPAKKTDPPNTKPSGVMGYVRRAITSFLEDECTTYGAALAYYSVFSLAPLLLLVIAVAGLFLGRDSVQQQMQEQIQGLIGSDAAGQIGVMMRGAGDNQSGNVISAVIGFIVLLFGATGAFAALQDALNKVWHVTPDPNAGVKAFIGKRILSFGLILVVAFLLLVSLVISAALAAFDKWMAHIAPAALSGTIMQWIGILASLVVITALFATIFKMLPDAKISWRDVAVGAALTSVMFTIGKTLIGLYIGKSGTASAFGAAGSLVVVVFWLYYSSLILLLGAEFTKVWAAAHGQAIEPEAGAAKVIAHERLEKYNQNSC